MKVDKPKGGKFAELTAAQKKEEEAGGGEKAIRNTIPTQETCNVCANCPGDAMRFRRPLGSRGLLGSALEMPTAQRPPVPIAAT
eukprot:302603-Pleurochrysis_carterae.AAC.5